MSLHGDGALKLDNIEETFSSTSEFTFVMQFYNCLCASVRQFLRRVWKSGICFFLPLALSKTIRVTI